MSRNTLFTSTRAVFSTREQPELFDRTVDNVVEQSRTLGVEYPIAVDSDFAVWRAFANHFWPAIYIAARRGGFGTTTSGEGKYAMTEMVIQQILLDAGAHDIEPGGAIW